MPSTKDGLIDDVPAARAWIHRTIDPDRQAAFRRSQNGEPGVLEPRKDARTRLLIAQAQKLENENNIKFGELFQGSVVRERDRQNVLAAKALILSFPRGFVIRSDYLRNKSD
jgi:hypothetical protein